MIRLAIDVRVIKKKKINLSLQKNAIFPLRGNLEFMRVCGDF